MLTCEVLEIAVNTAMQCLLRPSASISEHQLAQTDFQLQAYFCSGETYQRPKVKKLKQAASSSITYSKSQTRYSVPRNLAFLHAQLSGQWPDIGMSIAHRHKRTQAGEFGRRTTSVKTMDSLILSTCPETPKSLILRNIP